MTDLDPPRTSLAPLLVVRDAPRAIDFYRAVFGAREIARFVHPWTGAVSHADLDVGGASFAVTEEARVWNSDSPPSLGGSPVVLQLRVVDAAAIADAATRAGAELVFPLIDVFGERMARLRDPFGHLWLISQRLEDLSIDEIRRRRDAFADRMHRARGGGA